MCARMRAVMMCDIGRWRARTHPSRAGRGPALAAWSAHGAGHANRFQRRAPKTNNLSDRTTVAVCGTEPFGTRHGCRIRHPPHLSLSCVLCLNMSHDGASLSARSRRGLAARPARPRPPSLSSACLGPDRFRRRARHFPPSGLRPPGPARGAERDRGTGRGRPRRPAGESESAACSAMGGRACVLRPDRASHSHRPPRARRAQPRGTARRPRLDVSARIT